MSSDPPRGHQPDAEGATERLLRGLAIHDAAAMHEAMQYAESPSTLVNRRDRAMIQLAALISIDGPPASIERAVAAVLGSGLSAEEVTEMLVILAPTIGGARLVAAAPSVATGLGYDLDAALEGSEPRTTMPDPDGSVATT